MNTRRDHRRLMVVVIAFAVLAALGPLFFLIGGNLVGFIYIGAAVALFAYVAARGEPGGQVEVAAAGDRTHRILVVAGPDADAAALVEALNLRRAGEVTVHIVVPTLATRTQRFTGEVDSAVDRADEGAERLVEAADSAGRRVEGSVGDADPRKAVEDALRDFAADEVLVLPPPEQDVEFFRVSGPEETFQGVRLPVTVLAGEQRAN